MTLKSKRVVILTITSTLMALLRTMIINSNLEKNELAENTYYLSDSAWVVIFPIVCILFMFLFGVVSFFIGRKKSIVVDHSVGSVPAGSLVFSFSLVFAAFMYLSDVFSSKFPQYTVIGLLVLGFSILTAARFFYCGLFYSSDFGVKFLSFTALAPIFLSMLRLLGDFIRKSAAPFSSSGAYQLIGLIALMLFFMLEGKSYTSSSSASLYYFFGCVAVLFLLVYSIPNLVLHCFGAFKFNYYTAFSVADLGAAIYIATRLSYVEFKKIPKE